MPRIRSIKPEFWQDSRLSRLPALTRLVYVCLWSMADDEGRIEGDAETVRSFGFPRESIEDVSRALATLREHSRALAYTHEGVPHLALPRFTKHQKIDHPSQSKLPAPPTLTTDSTNPREPSRIVAPDQGSGIRDQGEDQGREGRGREEPAPPPSNPIVPSEPGSAADLSNRIGDDPDKCAQAIRELEAQGVPPDRIRSRVEAAKHGQPIGVWAWKASVLAGWKSDAPKPNTDHGPRTESTNGVRLAKIAAENARAMADLEAFKASGCATRSEWVARKAQA